MVHIFALVMNCYDWAAGKSLCYSVFVLNCSEAVRLAGSKCELVVGGLAIDMRNLYFTSEND